MKIIRGMKRLSLRRKTVFSLERSQITGGMIGRLKKWYFLPGAKLFLLHLCAKPERNGRFNGQADMNNKENINFCTNRQ